ncbi:hypothetical protein GEV33_002852 [Tenebrio molitor]|uniref:Uncharacterized protein n=1 Tax=Tenebrio molitor TaxID=7067 RepID=A0A8J6LEI9_TENMO|nr:hypothetical protein GEV33_002852 [Tenebrio molitor]
MSSIKRYKLEPQRQHDIHLFAYSTYKVLWLEFEVIAKELKLSETRPLVSRSLLHALQDAGAAEPVSRFGESPPALVRLVHAAYPAAPRPRFGCGAAIGACTVAEQIIVLGHG